MVRRYLSMRVGDLLVDNPKNLIDHRCSVLLLVIVIIVHLLLPLRDERLRVLSKVRGAS